MSLTASLLHLPPLHSLKLSSSATLTTKTTTTTRTTHFLHGSTPLSFLSKPSSSLTKPTPCPSTFLPPVRAMRSLQGRVVCATNDKTVAVEVVRLAPHPKYKRRVRKKKKFQAHDPDNKFKVGDYVQLEKSRPISKIKTFVAVPIPARNSRKKDTDGESAELGIPLESQQPQA